MQTMEKIRIGIMGYGNIGRGVEKAVTAAPDMELKAVFTRRDPASVETSGKTAPVYRECDAAGFVNDIDVMVLCGGSATDLETQGPRYAALFNTVDSFDTHAKIPEYLAAVEKSAEKTTAIISSGWDPGLFSMMRALFGEVIPDGVSYTFWGRGVSQGHSDAIRRIEGVKRAIQYTVPIEHSAAAARSGAKPLLSVREMHHRECYVVAEEGADKEAIETKIRTMPNYFSDYDTTINFIEDYEFINKHSKMPHGGTVIRSGSTGENVHMLEFSLKLDSNPEFTGSVMAACARAAARMSREGMFGAKTVLDIPLSYFSPAGRETLIRELL